MTQEELTALAKNVVAGKGVDHHFDITRFDLARGYLALLAERDALKAQVDEAYEKGVSDVFSRVEDITHGNYDAATFRLRFRLRAREEGAHR